MNNEYHFTIVIIITGIITRTSDLQPNTAIVNQLPGQLCLQIRTIGVNCNATGNTNIKY